VHSLGFLGLAASGWYALGQMLVGLAAVGSAIWALRVYKASRGLEAAKWLDGIFRDFYVNESFADVRWLLARRTFIAKVVPILERSIDDPTDILNEEDARTLHRIDRLLNFFEHVLYMESEGHLPGRAREAFFGYWFELMKSEPYRPLKSYLQTYGYEYLANFLSLSEQPRHDAAAKRSRWRRGDRTSGSAVSFSAFDPPRSSAQEQQLRPSTEARTDAGSDAAESRPPQPPS
jgi:hypothetical protein